MNDGLILLLYGNRIVQRIYLTIKNNTMKKSLFALLLLAGFMSTSCAFLEQLAGTGEPATKEVEAPTHKKIETAPKTISKQISPTDSKGLVSALGLEGDKATDFSTTLLKYNKMRKALKMENVSGDKMIAEMSKILTSQNADMKKLLSASQFETYLSLISDTARESGSLKVGGGE